MAKNAGSQRQTDSLLQVAAFLKQADKFVRDRNYASALDQISLARAKDPNNSYAEAYEQRVKLLVSALSENKQARNIPNGIDSSIPHSFAQHLESIANLAILKAHRTANLSLQQQTLEHQKSESRNDQVKASFETPLVEKETQRDKEAEVRACLRSAEELFRARRFDEALNTLAPAILIDPLNGAILELEHQIHSAQEEEIVNRVRQIQKSDQESKRVRETDGGMIQKLIAQAMQFTERKEFAEALLVIGQGYLMDPFNGPLANCEKKVLAALGKDMSIAESSSSFESVEISQGGAAQSHKNEEILPYLDRALAYLSEDRIAECLTQVSLAITMIQHTSEPAVDRQEKQIPVDDAHQTFSEFKNGIGTTRGNRVGGDERRIFDLIDKAKRQVGNLEFESGLETLLQADCLIPSDGSLNDLELLIANKFMDYFRLMQASKRNTTIQGDPPSLLRSERQSPIPQTAHGTKSVDNRLSAVEQTRKLSPGAEIELEFENASSDSTEDRLIQMKKHLLRSLRHLESVRLVEASVEGELASLVDGSKKEIGEYAKAVSSLARKAKAHVPIDTLHDQFDAVRQQGKDLIHSLCYEEILDGIDLALQALPLNNTLLKRRGEVQSSFQQCKQAAKEPQTAKGVVSEASRKTLPAARRTKRHSLDQMGLTFSDEFDNGNELDILRLENDSDMGSQIPVRKSIRNGSSGSSSSSYLGN